MLTCCTKEGCLYFKAKIELATCLIKKYVQYPIFLNLEDLFETILCGSCCDLMYAANDVLMFTGAFGFEGACSEIYCSNRG